MSCQGILTDSYAPGLWKEDQDGSWSDSQQQILENQYYPSQEKEKKFGRDATTLHAMD